MPEIQLKISYIPDTVSMNCPNDNEILVMSERSGIEIDYCPTCRGVWLDRGELDKLIEKNATSAAPTLNVATPQVENITHAPQEYQYNNDRNRDDYHGKRRKKESFLGDLFDF